MTAADPLAEFLADCEAHCARTGMGRSVLSHLLFNRGSRIDELAGSSSLSVATLNRARARLAELSADAAAKDAAQ